jgi:hypothetical protein
MRYLTIMTFKDESSNFAIKVFAILIILVAIGYKLAKQDEEAPIACQASCEREGGYYTGYGFTWIFIVNCYCIQR